MKQKLLLIAIFICSFNLNSQVGGALDFDGVNDYANMTNQTQTFNYNSTSIFSIEFLIQPSDKLTSQTIIGKGSRNDNKGFIIKVENNIVYIRNRDVIIGDANTAIAPSGWSHVAITYNQSAVKIYINGVLKKSGTLAINPFNVNTVHKMFIGARRADNGDSNVQQKHFKGRLDELRFWNSERSQAQIDNSKGCALIGTETNLVAYFNFNQGTANGNNTTITSLINYYPTYNATLNLFALTGTTSNFVEGSTSVVGTCSTLSTNDLQIDSVKVYPNPTNGKITIDNANGIQIIEIIISNLNGKEVLRYNHNNLMNGNMINIEQLNSGIYFMTLKTEKSAVVKKILLK
jgi:hypothetical protein